MEIRAPHDGIVKDLTVHTLGAVVQAGSPLLQVVPTGDRLRAEALLANEDIGFVEIGQPVKLKLAAYPFQKFGMLDGRVVQISADAIGPNEAARTAGVSAMAAPAQTYRAVIELAEQGLRLPNGRYLDIAPGMVLTAEIHQGRRTVMEYLLSPVQRVAMEAGRER
jgi:HlyD family secretion protein